MPAVGQTENGFQKHGTIHYRYQYKTKDGEEFFLGASLTEVPEALRSRLAWVATRLSLQLQDLMIDTVRELEQ